MENSEIKDVKPDEYPMYNGNEQIESKEKVRSNIQQTSILQGQGSGLNSDTVDGYQVSTYEASTPNTLVPIGPDGRINANILPLSGAVDILARIMALMAQRTSLEI